MAHLLGKYVAPKTVCTMRYLISLAVLVGIIALGFWFYSSPQPAASAQTDIETFLAQHWQRPLAPQGKPPAHFSELEASLSPQACGQCHQQQWQDWQNSLHSKTMGAGLAWQLQLMDQQAANACLECHAPLVEQKALSAIRHQWPNQPQGALPSYVEDNLDQQGLVCAACHVRQHQRFGPFAQNSTHAAPHGGFTEHAAFSDSRFCASCHQFPEDGARTAGKLRENTYQEWLASPYAEQGVHCQTCHMPDRKHQWQGVHSKQMVEQANSSTLVVTENYIQASLTNSGAGHYLPTYLVPKLHLQLVAIQDEQEQLLAEKIIGWQVSLDLTTEQFDTRLAPFATMTIEAEFTAQADATIELRLLVDPDQHYREAFANSLQQATNAGNIQQAIIEQLQQAYQQTQSSSFTLVLKREQR